MSQVVQTIGSEPKNTVEIVVHVTEGLDEDRRNHLESALKSTDGITAAEFC